MQADPFGDACCSGGLVKDATQLAVGKMLPLTTTGEQPALFDRHVRVKACRAHPPPLAQRLKQLFWQHDVPVLTRFRLHDADDHLSAIDIADFKTDDLAGAQPAAI